MKKAVLLAVILLATAGAAQAKNDDHPGENDGKSHGLPVILSFDTMYGVDGPLLGEANAIRGVVGDEAPWTIAHFIKGRLDKGGRLSILVRGLVFADDPLVDPDLVGKNDEATYRGLVSCLTEDEQGGISTMNVVTDGFPASVDGNSFIDQTLSLPNPCIAPIIFVMAGSEDKWFAVTGFESESDSHAHSRRSH
ncbi:MAG TPA: hypothetical protein VFB49_08075 [Patescibacteria group bacterium]|jgi:hypothetical protein|nr:hypothetical protein [Patescibacteria group bacterium]